MADTSVHAWDHRKPVVRLPRKFLASKLLQFVCGIALALILPLCSSAQCLSGGGGAGYILVKTTYSSYIAVGNPDCTRNYSYEIYDFSLTLVGFTPDPPVQIWNGSGDPGVHDPNVLTVTGIAPIDGGNVGLYTIHASSLKDLGTYSYEFQGDYDDGSYVYPMQPDVLPFIIGNSPPTANLAVAGALKVGNTITFNANGHDNDPGALHYNWSITARPPASPGNLSNPNAASPTMAITDKHDIGNWTVHLELADAQGELKTFDHNFQVINQPPTLDILGPTTINALDHLHLEASPATDADGEDVTWVWDLTQSPPTASRQPMSSFSTEQVIDFVTGPHDIGTWKFHCTATDEGGLTAGADVTVTVNAIPPQINIVPASPLTIKVGDTIQFADTIPNDAYGAPLHFDWEVTQAPIPGGFPLGPAFGDVDQFTIPTAAAQAGTWKFKLTVNDQVNQTAEQEVKVLVDAQPIATILGPDQTGNLTLPLDLDGTSSTDPDSPNTPPDYNHLHSGPVDVSLPTIAQWQWSIVDFPPERYGDVFPGPVSDNFGVNDTSGTLHIPAGKLSAGDWTFQLDVMDAEGNHATTTKSVQVLDESLPPLAIVLPPEATYTTDVNGVLSQEVKIDGSLSFDPDNLLNSPWSPGLGITNYAWSYSSSPAGCTSPPSPPSGPTATTFTLFNNGATVDPTCQGTYVVNLQVTDDDTPTAKTATNNAIVRIANCPSAVCIDYPRQITPQFVKFSNQTDVVIWYHLNSLLYDQPALAAGLRLQLQIFLDTNVTTPVYSQTWDVDVLPSNKGGALAVHWYGYDDSNNRPVPGKYNIVLQILDASNNPSGYSASETDAIEIQTLNIAIANTTDSWLNNNGLVDGTDSLSIQYTVSGQQGGTPGFDELRYRIYDKDTNAKVFEDQYLGPFNGSLSWNGDLGSSNFLPPGKYQLELEILDAGASLGISPRYDFRDYHAGLDLAGIPDSDKLTPGAFLKEGDTINLTAKLDSDPASLPGDTVLTTDDEPGTLTATDAGNPVDVDAGVSVSAATLTSPKVYVVKGTAPGAVGKTTLSFSYQPPGAAVPKKAVAKVGITVTRTRLRAVSSDPTRQDTDGIFLAGSSAAPAVTAANFGMLKYQMRPVTITVQPDISGGTVVLDFDSGDASQVELYVADPPNTQLVLPHTWTTTDFSSHKLDVPLLAYGKNFGDVVLKLTYNNGPSSLGEQKIKLRVRPIPEYTGIDTAGTFPFFRVLRTANLGTPLETSIDPMLHEERLNAEAAIYLVAHKSLAQWAVDPTLADVRGAPTVVTVHGTSIQDNIVSLSAPGSPGAYDVVYDFGNFPDDPANFATDATLNPGDILDDGGADQPSVVVEGSFTAPGPQAVAAPATYDFPAAVSVPAGYDGLVGPFNFRLRGQVVYPATLPGPAPLVVFAHGNHVPLQVLNMGVWTTVSPNLTTDENYKGHTYLQNLLASQGFVTISVDLDQMYGDPTTGYPDIDSSVSSGIKLRAWITLKNIEKVLSDMTIAGGALSGKIDSSRIYLVGHSRGGEAVIVALHLLKAPADAPGGASPAGFTASGIKGILSISPITRQEEAGGIAPQDVPFLLLYGSADGDVNGAMPGVEPFRHYDRAVSDRYAIRILGANHNYFNTSWAYSDASEQVTGTLLVATKSPLVPPVGAALLTAAQQQDVARGYVAAFLALVDKGDVAARNYFLEPPAHLRPLGIDPAIPLHNQARRVAGVSKTVVDDYETFPSVAVSSSGQVVSNTLPAGAVNEALLQDPGAMVPDETEVFNRFFQETHGVLLGWSAPAEYIESIGAADQDLRSAHVLSFRIAQQPKDPLTVAVGGPMTLSVELEDAAGKTSAVTVGILDSIPGIYVAQLAGIETTSAAFKTFRIPVASFASNGRDIDLGHITRVHFLLAAPGDSAQGKVGIDDIEVER